jgi:hypothetical protein
MRVTAIIFIALVLRIPGSTFAQEWIEYTSREDAFLVNFPVQPNVRAITFTSEYGYPLPARVYTVERAGTRYMLTVVDYRGIEQQGIERAKACPVGAEPCRGQPTGVIGPGYSKMDVRGALFYALSQFLQRDLMVTHMSFAWTNLIEGLYLQFTNPDQSRTYAAIHMHENRLYVQEGTVPKDAIDASVQVFQQSLGFLTPEGNPVRYQGVIYSNAYHGTRLYPPPVAPPPAAGGGSPAPAAPYGESAPPQGGGQGGAR